MNISEDLFKYNHVLLKYMDQVKLYEREFSILDRYRGFLEIVTECRLRDREVSNLLHHLFKEDELDIFKQNGEDYIVYRLKRIIMQKYIDKEKGECFYE